MIPTALLVLLCALCFAWQTPAHALVPDPIPPLPRTPAPLEPAAGALFGAFVDSDGRWTRNADFQADVTSYEALIGRKLEIDHHYYAWTDTFPSGLEQ